MSWKYGTYSGGPPGGQGFRIQQGRGRQYACNGGCGKYLGSALETCFDCREKAAKERKQAEPKTT